MIRSRIKFAVVLLCMTAAVIAWSAGGTEGTVSTRFRMDEDASIEQWDKEAERLSAERYEFLDDLIRHLRREEDVEKKGRICFLLGDYRAHGAVQDLSKHITLKVHVSGDPWTRIPLWGQYPAREALIKIGVRSTKWMLKNLATSEDAMTREHSVYVLREVYSPEIAKIVVQKAAEKEADPKRKRNLESALKQMK